MTRPPYHAGQQTYTATIKTGGKRRRLTIHAFSAVTARKVIMHKYPDAQILRIHSGRP